MVIVKIKNISKSNYTYYKGKGYNFGIKAPFMYLLVDSLIEMMSYYSDLSGKSDFIKDVLIEEEKVFNRLLANSSKIIKSDWNLNFMIRMGYTLKLPSH